MHADETIRKALEERNRRIIELQEKERAYGEEAIKLRALCVAFDNVGYFRIDDGSSPAEAGCPYLRFARLWTPFWYAAAEALTAFGDVSSILNMHLPNDPTLLVAREMFRKAIEGYDRQAFTTELADLAEELDRPRPSAPPPYIEFTEPGDAHSLRWYFRLASERVATLGTSFRDQEVEDAETRPYAAREIVTSTTLMTPEDVSNLRTATRKLLAELETPGETCESNRSEQREGSVRCVKADAASDDHLQQPLIEPNSAAPRKETTKGPVDDHAKAASEASRQPRRILRGWKEILTSLGLEVSIGNQRRLRRVCMPLGLIWRADGKPEAYYDELLPWHQNIESRSDDAKATARSRKAASGELGERGGKRATDHGMHIERRPNARGKVRGIPN